MGTRSGDLDPAVVECIANNEHLTPSETLNVLNKKSGLLGLSGVSSDMRDVRSAAAEGNAMAKVTLDIWAYRIRKYIGAYAAAMGRAGRHHLHCRHRRERRRGPRGRFEGPRVPRRQAGRGKERQGARRGGGDLCAGQQGQGLGHPHQRGVGHRPRHADAHQQVNRFLRRFGGERRAFSTAMRIPAGEKAGRAVSPLSPSLLTRAAHFATPRHLAGRQDVDKVNRLAER